MRYLIFLFAFFLAAPAYAQNVSGPVACTMEYAPVCGVKQVQCVRAPCHPVFETYSNSCILNASGATYVHAGKCTGDETVNDQFPVSYAPPPGCIAWFDGCNSCSGENADSAACTKKACEVYAPGYCTTWADHAQVTPSEEATTTATSTVPERPSLLSRIWNFLFGWL